MRSDTPATGLMQRSPPPLYGGPMDSSRELNRRVAQVQRAHYDKAERWTGPTPTQPLDPEEETFRHSGWREKRRRVITALESSGVGERRVQLFKDCGADCVVEWSPSEKRHRLRANYCKCRHCQPCMRAKANKLATNLQKKIEGNPHAEYRFITLTLRHTDAALAFQIKRLYACFKKLRALPLWKKTQHGGATTLEVKWGERDGLWHPHLHIIVQGKFLRQSDLASAWLQVTGDSRIVDIRKLNTARDAAFYVAKYVTKGTSDEVWSSPAAAEEWIKACHGVRVCATFGTWRGFKLLANSADPGDWRVVDLLTTLIAQARAGDDRAAQILIHIRRPGTAENPRQMLLPVASG